MKWSLLKLTFNLVLIPLLVIGTLKLTAPDKVTENFFESAPHFYVLGTQEESLRMLTLKDAIQTNDYEYHLKTDSIELNTGDIHHINLVSSVSGEQIIRFNYSNSYTSTSEYRVKNNEITPLSYQVTSHFRQTPFLLVAFLLAIGCSSLLTTLLKNRLLK